MCDLISCFVKKTKQNHQIQNNPRRLTEIEYTQTRELRGMERQWIREKGRRMHSAGPFAYGERPEYDSECTVSSDSRHENRKEGDT